MSTSKHSELILDQFTRQADVFSTARSILADLAGDTMDLHVRRDGERVRLGHPIAVLAARRP